MKNKFLVISLMLIICVVIYLKHQIHFINVQIDQIKQIFPKAQYIKSTKINWSSVYDSSKNKIGEVVDTIEFSDEIRGYAGPVPVLIGKDLNNEIVALKVLINNETPDVMKFLSSKGFFDSWNGISIDEAKNKKVEAVTGATITTEAVIANVKSVLGDEVEIVHKFSLLRIVCVIIILIFSLLSFIFPKKLVKFRILLAVMSIIVLGFFTASFLCMHLFYGWIVYGVFLSRDFLLLIVLFLSIILPFVTGKKFYCNFVCPYGFAQELVGKIIKKKFSVSLRFLYVRKIFLSVIVLLLMVGIKVDLSRLEPFSVFLFKSVGLFVIILAGVFLIVSIFINKPWCRYFCPTGQILDLVISKRRN